ncbi:MAG TPA: hypothetical protein VF446_11435 [Trinickia sp.]
MDRAGINRVYHSLSRRDWLPGMQAWRSRHTLQSAYGASQWI